MKTLTIRQSCNFGSALAPRTLHLVDSGLLGAGGARYILRNVGPTLVGINEEY